MIRLLSDDMGLGKTRVALHWIPIGWGALVVCPVNAKAEWARECKELFPDIKVTICPSPAKFRLPVQNEMLICNYEQIADREAPMVSVSGHKFIMIGDELHLVKNAQAARTKRFRTLADAIRKSGGLVYGLTGTPMLNRTKELWAHAVTLGVSKVAFPGGWAEFASLAGLGKTTQHTPRGPVEIWDQVRPPSPGLKARMDLFMIRRERKEVFADTPPKLYKELSVELKGQDGAEIRELLGKFGQEMGGQEIEEYMEKDLELETFSRIRSLASAYKQASAINWCEEHEELYPKDLDGTYPSPVLVAGIHLPTIQKLGSRPGWRTICGDVSAKERGEIAQLFRDGKLAGVALTITAGGAGINLYRPGAHNMLFIERDWRPGMNLQAEDRLRPHLIKEQCIYTDLILEHPIDRVVSHCLIRKTQLLESCGLSGGDSE